MKSIYLLIVLAPLFGAAVAGLAGRRIGWKNAHRLTVGAVAVSALLSLVVLYQHVWGGVGVFNESLYQWALVGGLNLEVGFLVDRLTALMMVVVTTVSLAVHVYTIGYMYDDAGYARFFSFINLFTFSMLMLVMANNFLQLFFGWEAVGLVSYLLIGFWYQKETAIFANLKAFLVNRVGDFGFLLGIAAVLTYYGSLDYAQVFTAAAAAPDQTMTLFGTEALVATVAAILLFIGAMGKSAQVPLHVWLPDSMEGPTPISALIHAATMVTAGIFLVARLSPLFELSDVALSVVLILGAVTALFMGLVGLVQTDIKRVIAYSTLSQLGYMFVGLGASAYAAGVFHVMTHAFFKALLFLGAGAVIVALHHEQDMRRMGNLRRYLPVTHITMLLGTLALVGTPFFSGYYSKDAIIEAVHLADRFGAGFAYWAVLLGVFITALYSFRLYFLVFWGEERIDPHAKEHIKQLPRYVLPVMEWPLVALAIPSVVLGYFTIEPLLFGDFFGSAIQVAPANDVLAEKAKSFHGPFAFGLHAAVNPAFWLAVAGAVLAWFLYLKRPDLLPAINARLSLAVRVLKRKYGFDDVYNTVFAGGGRLLGRALWRGGDQGLIDGVIVNGTARTVGRLATALRGGQTGFLYHYAFVMIVGLLVLLTVFVGSWRGWF
ncbi:MULTISPECIES: NADH-quinone oxidoreductase subunit L [Spiribacter]|jgi:NADH-quinone oxidoreductase subunit L|uniref:NADH-quinone oxidoreductase subunit L n=1 Tax=Spiribacter aquaticus TaxID=1935996 RepID=A0A557RJV1_9GAMM|nr:MULTISPECIES: NADH-quinone oxidoreductase subunit L [Spiribacter]AUB78066.1 NADH-quinone oxidoreductase subunit L [Spiribacter roseus]KAF0280033.1 NADH-quinone oxidoreductase subunit L [Spiribacter roseus]KAF0283687.1 NADH-quinone oxidoreductase subunit L [Spiribacter roseus]KAF0286171.1 NADH-quinone oxidoreductase subunit L [Spiribacter sp. SSL99]TVO65439.1 NADH-quinone oxidoreductase subunit L [Spiribacter aquaticus]